MTVGRPITAGRSRDRCVSNVVSNPISDAARAPSPLYGARGQRRPSAASGLPIRNDFGALSRVDRFHRIALAFLERGIDPGDRLLTPLLEPENLHAQLPRQKFHRLATQKPQGNLTLARHRPPLAKSQRACRETWPGGNVDEPSSPSFTTGPSTATLFSKLSVMFRSSLDTSIKPILCPRKSGPTQIAFLLPLCSDRMVPGMSSGV